MYDFLNINAASAGGDVCMAYFLENRKPMINQLLYLSGGALKSIANQAGEAIGNRRRGERALKYIARRRLVKRCGIHPSISAIAKALSCVKRANCGAGAELRG